MISYVSSPCAHYRAYIETICSYGKEAAETHLSSSGFAMDAAEKFEALTAAAAGKGTAKRIGQFAKSATVDFCTPLHSDILRVDKLLPNRMSMDISLTREADAFSIMTDEEGEKYKIHIVGLRLHVRKIQCSEAYVGEVNRRLDEGQRARYPLTRSLVKTMAIPTGSLNVTLPNLYNGRMPQTVIVALVESTSFTGALKKNPFNFQHFGISEMHLSVNSKSYPAVHYTPTFNKNLYMREYRCLNDALGIRSSNQACLITPELYKNGATLFAFDLTPDGCSGFHVHRAERGHMQLDFTFSTASIQNITVVIYSTMNDEFQVSNNLFLSLSFSAG